MALIHEEIEHEFGAEILVTESEPDEVREPWRIISLEIDRFDNLTPTELKHLGKWLLKQGRRIGKQYNLDGSPKAAK